MKHKLESRLLAGRNINNIRYADDITLMAQSEEELRSFLMYIQVSQEAGKVVWYSHLLKNFLQFVVIHTVTGFGIVNKAEINIFLELSSFFDDPTDVGNLISGSSAFPKTSLNIWKFTVHVLLKSGLENFEHCTKIVQR